MAIDRFRNKLEIGDVVVTTCNTDLRPGVVVNITPNTSQYVSEETRECYARVTIAYAARELKMGQAGWEQRVVKKKMYADTYMRIMKVPIMLLQGLEQDTFDMLYKLQQETLDARSARK